MSLWTFHKRGDIVWPKVLTSTKEWVWVDAEDYIKWKDKAQREERQAWVDSLNEQENV